MKTLLSNPMPSDWDSSVSHSGILSSTKISKPAKTLLVVDDDPNVRELEVQILQQQGYSVLQAENAAEALRIAREAAAIHLLITDFSMPEVDGLELFRQFRAMHPATPVLMVSGSLAVLRDETEDLPRLEFLPKPFSCSDLLRKVRSLLDTAVPLPRRKPWCCD
jgi:two-component system, cell cycle sensor histidine kinase and response regulator CckA